GLLRYPPKPTTVRLSLTPRASSRGLFALAGLSNQVFQFVHVAFCARSGNAEKTEITVHAPKIRNKDIWIFSPWGPEDQNSRRVSTIQMLVGFRSLLVLRCSSGQQCTLPNVDGDKSRWC